MIAGTRVTMSGALIKSLKKDHVELFGNAEGTVLGYTQHANHRGPEVDVQWDVPEADNCLFFYLPDELIAVTV